jgi:vancomycin resistance protein YoaR
MKKHAFMQNGFSLHLLLAPLILLSGCIGDGCSSRSESCGAVAGEVKEKNLNDGSPVLMTIGDRVVITQKSFDEELNTYLSANPQAQQMLMMMPDLKLQFLNGIVSQELVDEYVHRNKLNQTAEYKQERERIMAQIDKALNARLFADKLNVSVPDADVRKFYDENRDKIAELMISQGGVKAEGVSFAQENDAKAFLAKAKEKASASLESIAEEAGHKKEYRDFKLVSERSAGIDNALKAKILSVTQVPSDQVVNAGNAWWVVRIHSKEEPKYQPYEQIKPALADHLKKMKEAEALQGMIEKLKTEYNVNINEAPVRPEQPTKKVAALDADAMLEQAEVMQQMPEALVA